MKILVLDNYDSFVYNLVHYLEEITGGVVDVFRNDEINIDKVKEYDYIILSPGPGVPKDAGIMPELIQKYAKTKPILGVCLGHQAIGEAFGSSLTNLSQVYHGVATEMQVIGDKNGIFKGISERFQAGRYHSWIIDKSTLSDELEITAIDENGEIMAIRHKKYDIQGVQFHPESIMTPEGKKLLANFLNLQLVES